MTENDIETTGTEEQSPDNVVSLPAVPKEPPHRKVAQFVHEHPVLTIAGGIAAGALAAALIPKRNRDMVTKRASVWADAVSAATAAIAQQALERAEAASSQVRNQADAFAERASDLGHSAKNRIEGVSKAAASKAQGLIDRSRPEPGLAEKLSAKAAKIIGGLHR